MDSQFIVLYLDITRSLAARQPPVHVETRVVLTFFKDIQPNDVVYHEAAKREVQEKRADNVVFQSTLDITN